MPRQWRIESRYLTDSELRWSNADYHVCSQNTRDLRRQLSDIQVATALGTRLLIQVRYSWERRRNNVLLRMQKLQPQSRDRVEDKGVSKET